MFFETKEYSYHPNGAPYESVVPCARAKNPPSRIIHRVDFYKAGDYIRGYVKIKLGGINPILELDTQIGTALPKTLDACTENELRRLSRHFPLEELVEIQQLERMLGEQAVNYRG